MKNLSFLKGLFIGIVITAVTAVAFANGVSSDSSGVFAWVNIGEKVYLCYQDIPVPTCKKATLIDEVKAQVKSDEENPFLRPVEQNPYDKYFDKQK